MIKKIQASTGEKILLIFLILLAIISFLFYFTIKNKCLFVEKVDLQKINFPNTENIVVMNVECGKVIIELLPNLSPNSVERFKFFISNGYYDGSAFYRVIKDTLIQAGDLEYGNIENIDYYLYQFLEIYSLLLVYSRLIQLKHIFHNTQLFYYNPVLIQRWDKLL